ncbi:MAG: serine/threonine-protein kinase [Kofleriaceae bacterium]
MAIDDSDPAHDATLAGPTAPVDTLASIAPSASGSAHRLSLQNYELGDVLGSGGMGEVIVAYDKQIGRDVAIKQMRVDASNADIVARFLREARIQARLEHPAIVPVHHMGTDEHGLPFFTMKKVTGTTLLAHLARSEQLPRPRLLRIFVDVCQAVEFAHARGVVHRDLKPANIMIGDFGEVYVLDWGLARLVAEDSSERDSPWMSADVSLDSVTQAGAMLGTPGYMSPDQIQDAHAVGPAADVYSLGAILYEILAGESPHPRQGAIASTLKGEIIAAAQRHPERNVPPELDALCISALASDAADRPSVKQLAEKIQGFLDGDRDVAARRELALVFQARAREALDSGDLARRAEAMHAAGRALVLDPESAEAAAIVSTLIFTPGREHPPQLASELASSEMAIQRRQGRAALASFAAILAFLATALTNGTQDWTFVVGVVAYLLVHASVVWWVTQRPATPFRMVLVAAANALLAALISRTYGSMVIVPAVTCIMVLSLTAYPQLIDRLWTVLGLLLTSWIVPVVLEAAGALAPTWWIDGDKIVLASSVMTISGSHTAAILIGSNVLTIIVFGLFSSALAKSRRNAMRQAEVQAWHLRQLLPTTRALTVAA